ncbi:hypothetical protein ACMFMG_006244 [Clarireedia jacksonii]
METPSKWSSIAAKPAAEASGSGTQPAPTPEIFTRPAQDVVKKRKQESAHKKAPKKAKLVQGNMTGAQLLAHNNAERKKYLDTYYNIPHGADYPPIASDIGDMSRMKDAILIVTYGTDTLMFDVRTVFDMFSQAPALKIVFFDGPTATNGGDRDVASFRAHNIAPLAQEDPLASPPSRFETAKLKMNLVTEDHQDPQKEDPAYENALCVCHDVLTRKGDFSHLHFLGFHHQGKFFFDMRNTSIETMDTKAIAKKQTLDRMEEGLNSGAAFITLVRRANKRFNLIDDHWMKLMSQACEHGTWSFYKNHIGKVPGRLFQRWDKNPYAVVPRQEWMRMPGTAPDDLRFATHPAQRAYATPRDMEIAQSLSVIGEAMWEKHSLEAYFVFPVKHMARVLERKGSYIKLEILVEKLDDIQMPVVSVGTSMKVKILPIVKEEGDQNPLVAPPTDVPNFPSLPEKASAVDREVHAKRNPNDVPPPPGGWAADKEYRARCIDVDTNYDFVIGFEVASKTEIKAFKRNDYMEVSIHMKRNPIPGTRQLQAIGRLCANPDTPSKKMMQEYFMGRGKHVQSMTIDEACKPRLSDAQRNALQRFTDRLNLELNGPQKLAFQAIFNSKQNHAPLALRGPLPWRPTRII